ncbi:spheroidene monooxygenase [Streptomyces sp. NPDC052496]|uniref:spheroidene monooxygenase n=1 Tax=Streptomyces sp. NPDC052496 TaxID=3154951 RepID=UPI0034382592
MIVSVHLADIGLRAVPDVLRSRPRPGTLPGLRHAQTTLTGDIAAGLPRLRPGRAALFASWEDDAALDRFLAEHPLARHFAPGRHVRLEPLGVRGSWSGMALDVAPGTRPADDDEEVAVLTLGETRLRGLGRFLRANSRASGRAATDPAMTFSAALARPPRFVGTFSIWRSLREMTAYAYGAQRPEHRDTVAADQARPFHHEAAFARFRPYARTGALGGEGSVGAGMGADLGVSG